MSDLAELGTHPRLYGGLCNLQENSRSNNVKLLELPHHNTSIFQTLKAEKSVVCGGIWSNFELIPSLDALSRYLQEGKRSNKDKGARVATTRLPLKVYGDFTDTQGQLTPQSAVELAEL